MLLHPYGAEALADLAAGGQVHVVQQHEHGLALAEREHVLCAALLAQHVRQRAGGRPRGGQRHQAPGHVRRVLLLALDEPRQQLVARGERRRRAGLDGQRMEALVVGEGDAEFPMRFGQGAEGLLQRRMIVAMGLAQFVQAQAGCVERTIGDQPAGIGAALFQIAQGAGAGPQDLVGSHNLKE